MKAVIVLGFYDRVFVHLQKKHSALFGSTIIWVGVIGPHGDGDVRNFKSLLFDRLENGFTNILVLSVVRRGREATHGEEVAAITRGASQRFASAQINLETFKYAEALDEVDARIQQFLGAGPAQGDLFPSSFDELESWCLSEHLRERLIVLPRAVDEAKRSQFEDVPFVYRSINLLAREYWDLRVNGGLERKHRWHAGLDALGLSVAPSISKSRAGEQKNAYFVNYPVGSPPGNKRFLEQHLKRGNDRDERFCFRLYFFWDTKKLLVVVGWLPSHLDTRQT